MATVFIANQAVSLPPAEGAGEPKTENEVAVLFSIQRRRIIARLRYLVDRGEISQEELQAKADELLAQEMTVYSTDDEDEPSDPILVEALSMAREIIVGHMTREGLPPPKGLDTHAKVLVDGRPDLMERARLRVEARYKAAEQALGGMN